MARIDTEALVFALESRIEALEKNPEDIISNETIISMLHSAIEDEVKKHLTIIVKKEILSLIKKEFSNNKIKLIKSITNDIFTDSHFRKSLEAKIKRTILERF